MSGRRLRRVARLWYYSCQLPQQYDIAVLRPPRYDKKGRNKGFETVKESKERDRKNIAVLQARGSSTRSSELADKLFDCLCGFLCGSSASKKCMRELRRTMTGLALPHAQVFIAAGLIPVLLTVVWTDPALRSPVLPKVNLPNLGQSFRMKLRRCELSHVPMIGGFEIDFNDNAKVWELHVHIVAFVTDEDELDPLKKHFKKAHGVSRPMQVKSRDPQRVHEAVVYCWKFAPMRKRSYRRKEIVWRNGKFRSKWKTRTRKTRLLGPHLRQALVWLDDRDPTEFLFLQRLKLVRSKLIPV
jgi:hypothetical protein